MLGARRALNITGPASFCSISSMSLENSANDIVRGVSFMYDLASVYRLLMISASCSGSSYGSSLGMRALGGGEDLALSPAE